MTGMIADLQQLSGFEEWIQAIDNRDFVTAREIMKGYSATKRVELVKYMVKAAEEALGGIDG